MAPFIDVHRRRVIHSVEGGMSRNAEARGFGASIASIASAAQRMDGYRRTMRVAPKSRGGDRRSRLIEAQSGSLMMIMKVTPDVTLPELRERKAEQAGDPSRSR